MAERTRGYAHRIDIAADGDRVWRALTDEKLVARWCGAGAAIRAREGGSFRAQFDSGAVVDAHIDVFDKARRLRLVHLPHSELPEGDAVVVDDILIEAAKATGGAAAGTQTVVRLLGSGCPDDPEWEKYFVSLRRGWERSLARLKVLLEKRLDQQEAVKK